MMIIIPKICMPRIQESVSVTVHYVQAKASLPYDVLRTPSHLTNKVLYAINERLDRTDMLI